MGRGTTAHRTAQHSAFDVTAQSVVLVFSLLSGIVVSRVLGPEGRGVFILAIAVLGGFLAELAGLGMYAGAQVFAGRAKRGAGSGEREAGSGERGASASRYLSQLHTLMVVVCLLGSLLCVALVLLFWPWLSGGALRGLRMPETAVVLGTLPAAAYLPVWHGFMTGIGALPRRARAEIVFGVIQAFAVIAFAFIVWGMRVEHNVLPIVIAYCSVQVIAALIMLRSLRRFRIRWQMPEFRLVRRVMRYGGVVWAGNLANALQRQAELLVVNVLLTPAALGIYSLAAGLASRSAIVAAALQRSLVGRVSAGGAREAARLCAAGSRQMLLIGAALVIAGLFAMPLIPMLYGEDFRSAAPLLVIVLAGWWFLGMSRMLAMFFSARLLRPGIPLLVNWIAFPVQVLALLVLVPAMGLWGAAWSFLLAAAAQFAIFAALFLRHAGSAGIAELLIPRVDDVLRWGALLRRGDKGPRA